MELQQGCCGKKVFQLSLNNKFSEGERVILITCICIIQSHGKIEGYRLFDIGTLEYKDVSKKSALQNIDKIDNLVKVGNSLAVSGYQDSMYPVYDRVTGGIYNSDKLVYVGRTDINIDNNKNKERYLYSKRNRLESFRNSTYNNVCKWDGTVYSIRADCLQEGILDRNCLNVVEGYTGGFNIPALASYGDILRSHFSYDNEVLYNLCFCSINEMYEMGRRFKQADIVQYRGALYNIAKHKRTNSSVIKGKNIITVYHCGIIQRYQNKEFKYRSIQEKLPLYIEDDRVYYVAHDKKVMDDNLYGYAGCSLEGVFNRSKLLDINREASFCIISANKIYVLAMGMLEELDRDTCMDKIEQAMKIKNRFSNKLKLVGNTDIGVDNKGRVTGYRLREEVNHIDIVSGIGEFDLRNINIDDDIKQKYNVVYVDLSIPDNHGLVYISDDIPGNIYFRVLKCNDVQLGKSLMAGLTAGFKREITWEIAGDKITLGLVKWAYSKWAYNKNSNNNIQYIIKIKPVGDLKVKTKDAIVQFLFSDKAVNLERTKEDIKWLNKHRNDISIASAVPIYIGDYMDGTYGYELKYGEIESLKLKMGDTKKDGDIYYGESVSVYVRGMVNNSIGTELVVQGNGSKISIADEIGIGLKVVLSYISAATRIIKLPYLRLKAFRDIDSRIDNVYKSLNDLYKSKYEGLVEDNQLSRGGMVSLLSGYLYKRDTDRVYRIVYRELKDSIEEVIYLKYKKHKLSGKERNIAEQRIPIYSNNSKSSKCDIDTEEHIQNSLPDEIWVSLARLFALEGRVYSDITDVEEALKMQGHIQAGGIKVWERINGGYLPGVIYKGNKDYEEISKYMVELRS